MKRILFPLLISLFTVFPLPATLWLPSVFSDNMVLQRNSEVTVWGWCTNTGGKVLDAMFRSGEDAETIVEREGLAQVSDADVLAKAVDRVLADHPEDVARYHEGQTKLLGWFIGQVMRETRGKANPGIVRQVLLERLG